MIVARSHRSHRPVEAAAGTYHAQRFITAVNDPPAIGQVIDRPAEREVMTAETERLAQKKVDGRRIAELLLAWKEAMWMGFSCVRMDRTFSASGEVA